MEKDLILLATQQEKLLAELARAYAEESEREREKIDSGRRAAFDQEMEARVRNMNLQMAPEEIEGALEEVREVRSHTGPKGRGVGREMGLFFERGVEAKRKNGKGRKSEKRELS